MFRTRVVLSESQPTSSRRLWKQLHDNVTRIRHHPTVKSLWQDVTQFSE